MKRVKLNFIIDIAAFVAFVFLTATGVLERYILPPGSGRFTTLWGMDRHEWGQIHFWIAVALFGILGLHLLLHWRWIVCMVQGRKPEESGFRVALAVVAVLALVGLIAAPFFVPTEQKNGEPPHRLRSKESGDEKIPKIDGSMTLRDVEKKTGVSAATILKELKLPSDTSLDEGLGRLRRQYGFEMHTVREIIARHAKNR